MSEQLIIKHCSPTLAGMKTGNLFSCACESREELITSVRRINRKLVPRGLRVLPFAVSAQRALVYVFRPDALEEDLSREDAMMLLKECGYDQTDVSGCLRELKRRLALKHEEGFPHEVGLFLSYPPEDVRGFIEHKAANSKCAGCWKVYGDEEKAKYLFTAYRNCTKSYCRRWDDGESIENLAVLRTH